MTQPDPELLRTYVTIVEAGSFTAAARRVHRTQSAVSMQMRRLEELVGNALFEKAGRKTRLTAQGELFLDHARRILHEYDQALEALNYSDDGGEITIGVPDDYAMTYLPDILGRFATAFTSLRITIVCEPSRKLSTMIANGSVDIALLTEGEGIGGGVVLHREELVWVSSANHRVHKQDPVPLAVFHSGDVYRRPAVQRLEDSGRRARIVVTSPSFAGINAALEAGIAVAVIARANVRPGFRILTPRDGFPRLPRLGIVLQRSDRGPRALIDRLVGQIVNRRF